MSDKNPRFINVRGGAILATRPFMTSVPTTPEIKKGQFAHLSIEEMMNELKSGKTSDKA